MAANAVIERKSRRVTPAVARRGKKLHAVPTVARRSDLPGSDENLDLSTIGGRIAYARLREEITQDQLAQSIDKVRATVVAYERNNIIPPLPIVQALALRLKVSATFLAFGEHGVKATAGGNAAETTVNVDEVTYGRDGAYVSGTFAMPRTLAASYVENISNLRVFVLGHHADAFNLRAGDRLFADASVNALTNDFDTYVIEVNGGMEIIRVAPTFAAQPASIMVEGSRGDKVETKVKSLKIVGAVVSTLRSQ